MSHRFADGGRFGDVRPGIHLLATPRPRGSRPTADTAYEVLLKGDGHTLAEGTYSQQRQDRANARFLKAAKPLVTVRRLLVPSVQIHVAKNQVISQ